MSCPPPRRREHCLIRSLIVLLRATKGGDLASAGDLLRPFVGDDWAEAHQDVEVMDSAGRRLAKARLPEGVAGLARLHAMIGDLVGDDADEVEVVIGIETDRGPGSVLWLPRVTRCSR